MTLNVNQSDSYPLVPTVGNGEYAVTDRWLLPIFGVTLAGAASAVLLGIIAVFLAMALTHGANAGTLFSNGVYSVGVQDAADGSSMGSWAAETGPLHPVGAGPDILLAGPGTRTTNYSSLRVYTGGGPVDFNPPATGGAADLDLSFISEGASPFSANGHRTTWIVTAFGLEIVQDVFISGTTFNDSAIYHTVNVTNVGAQAQAIGWRNLYDWQLSVDDGPANTVEDLGGTLVAQTTTEFNYTPTLVGSEFVRVEGDPVAFGYEVLASLSLDPALGPLATTAPEVYTYASWPGSVVTAFDYTIGPGNVSGDSAGLYYFGRAAATAVNIAPGSSARFTTALFGVVPNAPPPGGEAVPEPATWMLLSLGLAGYAGSRRLKRRRNR
jgi:hypothetical protein